MTRYGHQRMFGSLGWGLAMFFVGIALDHSTAFSDHPCKPDVREKNYTICFAIFSVLMGAALITATQINFKYDFMSTEPVSSLISIIIKLLNSLCFTWRCRNFARLPSHAGSSETPGRTDAGRATAKSVISAAEPAWAPGLVSCCRS